MAPHQQAILWLFVIRTADAFMATAPPFPRVCCAGGVVRTRGRVDRWPSSPLVGRPRRRRFERLAASTNTDVVEPSAGPSLPEVPLSKSGPLNMTALLSEPPSSPTALRFGRAILQPAAMVVSFVVRYFVYMHALWRPEGNLPRSVHDVRIRRWLGQLDGVVEREAPAEAAPARRTSESSPHGVPPRAAPGDGGRDATVPTIANRALIASRVTEVRAACEALNAALDREVEVELTRGDKSLVKRKRTINELGLRLITGWALGAGCTAWIFSGNLGHALGLYLLAIVAQLEYYRSVIATGVYPARRIGIVTTTATYLCACYAPHLHEQVLPLAATAIMVWFLAMRPKPGTIGEISSSFMGIFYVGYLPSFWVRLRTISEGLPVVAVTAPKAMASLGLPADLVTQGALVKWWICFTIVCSDVGAYFGGKARGRTPLSAIGRGAAGQTSPNKTVEGALSGFLASGLVSMVGARFMKWPKWPLTGLAFGMVLGLVAFIGDLTASMFKRDAGLKVRFSPVSLSFSLFLSLPLSARSSSPCSTLCTSRKCCQDFGNLFPGHGGVLDRFDSYIFTGPFVYFTMRYLLPRVPS
jgi:phosphatidate cytidylyltransferase